MDTDLTIILMCHNEGEYIEQTIDNILAVKPKNTYLIVGDNASTDNTPEILKERLSNRSDVKLILRQENIGALENFNDLCRNVNTEYLIFASAHDLWGDNYIDLLLSYIEKTATCAIAYAPTSWIDESGKTVREVSPEFPTFGLTLTKSFITVSIANQHYLNGVIRTKWLMQTRLNLPILGSFEIWLQELAAFGSFDMVEGTKWFRRKNRAPNNRQQILRRYEKSLFGNHRNAKRFKIFPGTQYILSYLFLPFYIKNINNKEKVGLIREAVFISIRKLPSILINDLKYMTGLLSKGLRFA